MSFSRLVPRYAAAALAISVVAGCDDHSSDAPPPPAVAAPKDVPPDPKRPTTQQILSAPRKPLALLKFPLTIDVPDLPKPSAKSPEWKINSVSGDTATGLWVEGPAPSGDIMIQLSTLPGSHPPSMLQVAENAALNEKAKHPEITFFSEARSIGPLRVIEQRNLRHDKETEIEVPNPGNPAQVEHRKVPPTDYIDWTLRVFIPTGKTYTEGTLTFVDLTKEQYDADKSFLNQLVASLHYDGSKGELP